MTFRARATAALDGAGYPLTPQRRAILGFLDGNDAHPSAADVCAALDGVSRATVYKTLSLLVRLGVCDAVPSPTGELRFDPRTDPHDHFACEDCGALVDLPLTAVRVQVPEGYAPRRSRVVVEGRCAVCASSDRGVGA